MFQEHFLEFKERVSRLKIQLTVDADRRTPRHRIMTFWNMRDMV